MSAYDTKDLNLQNLNKPVLNTPGNRTMNIDYLSRRVLSGEDTIARLDLIFGHNGISKRL